MPRRRRVRSLRYSRSCFTATIVAGALNGVIVGAGPETRRGRVALTFDDGPSPTTPAVLEALAEAAAPATFFVLGGQVEEFADVLRRTAAAGHEIGNHTWSHPDLDARKDVDLEDEIRRTSDAIERVAAVRPRLFRPPYGHDAGRWARAAAAFGLTTVLWSVQTWDWEDDADPPAIVERARAALHAGAIVLLHDGERHDQRPTADALPGLIELVRGRGYELVTVSDLVATGRARGRRADG